MGILLGTTGVLLIVSAVVDAVSTTIAAAGGGPLTTRLSRAIWALSRRQPRSERSRRRLVDTGTVILLVTMFLWVTMLWTGYFLLFSISSEAVLQASSRAPADLWSRVYFTGFTLFTLGVGDYVPSGAVWQVLTAGASINGLFVITLSITYLVPVLSAVVSKRRLAATIANAGMTPLEILRSGWDGQSFQALVDQCEQLAPMLEMHTQRHLAYPVLHFFRSSDPRTALGPRLAALSEALLVLAVHLPKDTTARKAIGPARNAIRGFLKTLDEAFIDPADTSPEVVEVDSLREADLPVVSNEDLQTAAKHSTEKRRLLRALVQDEGWRWEDVSNA